MAKKFDVRKMFVEMDEHSTNNIAKTIAAARDVSPKVIASAKKVTRARAAETALPTKKWKYLKKPSTERFIARLSDT